jgi:hypothetical protein
MTAVSVRGLAVLRRKLEARSLPRALKGTARHEAEEIAREAARAAPGGLGRTVEVKDASHGNIVAYAVGTADPAGRFVEHGTVCGKPLHLGFGRFSGRVYRALSKVSEIL